MKILLIDQNGCSATPVVEGLEYEGFKVLRAGNIYRAQKFIEENPDLIISDLAIRPEGLSEAEEEETQAGWLTGLVFLKRRVFPNYPELKKRTLILARKYNIEMLSEEDKAELEIAIKGPFTDLRDKVRSMLDDK